MVDKIEITTGRELSKYLTGFSNSVDKLNKIASKFQGYQADVRNAKGVAGAYGDAKGMQPFLKSLGVNIRSLTKEIANLNATDKMMARHMKNISSGSGFANRMVANKISMPRMGGYLQPIRTSGGTISKQSGMPQSGKTALDGMGWLKPMDDLRHQREEEAKRIKKRSRYKWNDYDTSKQQIQGELGQNRLNPWLGRRRAGAGLMGSGIKGLGNIMSNDPEWNSRPLGGSGAMGGAFTRSQPKSILSKFKDVGKGFSNFFKEDKDEFDDKGKPIKKKGIGGKIKGALKSPLGVIGGIGGAAMLGKKLIDSSPMLQAMMKMLNTTFTLILRPIGDFVGGMLRPITMFMLKEIAIPMAKKGKGFMKFGEEIGNKILGFFLRPIESIKSAIILAIHPYAKMIPGYNEANDKDFQWAKNYNGVTDWKLQKMIDNSEKGSEKNETAKWLKSQQKLGTISDEVITKSMDLLGGNVGSAGIDGSQAFGISAGGLESADEADQSIDEFLAFIQHMEASGQITSDEAKEMSHWMKMAKNAGVTTARNAIDMASTFEGANKAIQAKLKSLYVLQTSLAAQAHAQGKHGLEARLNAQAQTNLNIANSLGTPGTGDVAVDNFFGVNNAMDTTSKVTTSKSVVEKRETALATANKTMQTRVNAQAVQNALNPANGLSYNEREAKINKAVRDGDMSQATASTILGKLAKDMIGGAGNINLGTEGSSILRAYEEAKKNGTLGTATQDEFRAAYGGKQGDTDAGRDAAMQMLGAEGKTWEDYIASTGSGIDKETTWRDITKMANGGIINEPIFGIGRSGQKYQFGESGKEFVTPERKAGGTTFNVININVGNVNRDADFDKLKPLIQRWILESNSRRGMI